MSKKPSKLALKWSKAASADRKHLRRRIIERDGANCFHCGRPTRIPDGKTHAPDDMTIDHWPIPKRDLPESEWFEPASAVIACLECNQRIDHESQIACRTEAA